MKNLAETLIEAQKYAFTHRPPVGGFPFLADVLKKAGVKLNRWYLPSCQAIYFMEGGAVVQQGTPLETGTLEIPSFNESALIVALRADQAGKTSFPEFLMATWKAGIVSYDVDFEKRQVSYFGISGESYVEEYPQVGLKAGGSRQGMGFGAEFLLTL